MHVHEKYFLRLHNVYMFCDKIYIVMLKTFGKLVPDKDTSPSPHDHWYQRPHQEDTTQTEAEGLIFSMGPMLNPELVRLQLSFAPGTPYPRKREFTPGSRQL